MIREHNKKLNNLEVFYLTQLAFLDDFIGIFAFFSASAMISPRF